MSEPQPEQPSQEPADGAESGLIPAQELADALAEASKLADELARELDGEEPEPLQGVRTGTLSESPEVDEQLDDVDALLAITTDELGEAPAEETVQAHQELTAEEAANAIPDFMDEFTNAAAETAAAPDPNQGFGNSETGTEYQIGVRTGPKPGMVGSGVVGVAGEETSKPQAVVGDESEPVAPRRKLPNPREQVAKLVRAGVVACRKILARLFPLADRAVGLLEITDRPFARLKESVRRVVGWVAIATLGTSVLVFFWSLI